MISSDSPEIMRYVRGAFGRMRRPDPSGTCPLDRAEIAVAPARRGIRFNGEPIELPAEEMTTDAQLGWYGSSRLFRESFRRNDAWRGFHGAALRLGGHAFVLVGDSGVGKTTLTLALLSLGATFYSDEFAFVRRSDRMVCGYPRTLVVRRDTPALLADRRLERFCSPAEARPSAGGPVWDFVDAADLFGNEVFAEPAPLGAILLLVRPERPQEPSLEPVATALAALDVSPRLNRGEMGFGRVTDVAELLAGTRTFRLSLGPPATTAALLRERLT
ncbi:MAG: hypothetical protein ACLPYS_16355 [Vulcanimicrobiaceae bacterium]